MDAKNNKGPTFVQIVKGKPGPSYEYQPSYDIHPRADDGYYIEDYYAFNHEQYSDLGPRTDADEVIGNLLIIDDLDELDDFHAKIFKKKK
ncbi:MAG: hypothetical protein IJI22_05455 [Bacilli bacterium]|nr:hypothetical protein [Bacilli bacterium]